MKLDVRLLRKILNVIQEKESHYVSTSDIYEDIKSDYEYLEDEDFKDIFYGHLLLLKDNNVIEQMWGSDNLGISYTVNHHLNISGCYICMTSKGYDYLKSLNIKGKIENFTKCTLTEGLKLSELLAMEVAKDYLPNMLK